MLAAPPEAERAARIGPVTDADLTAYAEDLEAQAAEMRALADRMRDLKCRAVTMDGRSKFARAIVLVDEFGENLEFAIAREHIRRRKHPE